ncbi:MAG: polysaccharide deacetylase family protein [Lentisphaerae bacterium]|nr:polysaccharide deacetylase family protein [Lentisphaerota bacterium]
MKEKLFVLFTMDVEPTATKLGASGPKSDKAGMQSLQDFCSVLDKSGYRPTCFVHPELIEAYPEFYIQLAQAGTGIGLHLHTTKFAPAKQECELGGLCPDEQQRLLTMAVEMFERGFKSRPKIFRPGCFSANDATFNILVQLGFIGGGISIPERIWTDRYCVWSGSYPYAHYAHKAFRQCQGNLPFVDIPLSVDLTTPLVHNPVGFLHHPDLRPGGVYSKTDEVPFDRRKLLHNILHKMAQDNPPVKTLVIDGHNDRDFLSSDSDAAAHLNAVIDGIPAVCSELGWQPVSATYEEVIAHFMQMHPLEEGSPCM